MPWRLKEPGHRQPWYWLNRIHDGVIRWKKIPCYWPFVWGIHRSPVNSPHKGQWRGALMFPLICARTNSWVKNRDAGDLRHHGAHYRVTVIWDEHFFLGQIQTSGLWYWPLTCQIPTLQVTHVIIKNVTIAANNFRFHCILLLAFSSPHPPPHPTPPHPTPPPPPPPPTHPPHPPWTKWPPFRRRYFHMHFREWKVLHFDSNFTEVCS